VIDMNAVVGQFDIIFLTLDTLRADVAVQEWRRGGTPHLARYLGPDGWQIRHTPGSFTWAAHQAFFAGFLPTRVAPGRHPRLFATRFGGSTTTTPHTCVFDAPDIVTGLRRRGYHTVCIGGTGFFNLRTPLSRVLPDLFDEAHWDPRLGVADPHCAQHQMTLAAARLEAVPTNQRAFLFVNVSALHQPNRHYLDPMPLEDTVHSHAAALRAVDAELPVLFAAAEARGGAVFIVCADHGTAYGEDGYTGHRIGHPVVWTVPYATFGVGGAPRRLD
jgi:hypothetical protein